MIWSDYKWLLNRVRKKNCSSCDGITQFWMLWAAPWLYLNFPGEHLLSWRSWTIVQTEIFFSFTFIKDALALKSAARDLHSIAASLDWFNFSNRILFSAKTSSLPMAAWTFLSIVGTIAVASQLWWQRCKLCQKRKLPLLAGRSDVLIYRPAYVIGLLIPIKVLIITPSTIKIYNFQLKQ